MDHQEMADMESQTTNVSNNTNAATTHHRFPVTLKFKDIEYKIQATKKSEEKVILKGVSGLIKPGEILAMLGPSGSGKTTLLKALGGRIEYGELQGTITYNNRAFSNSMRRHTGFVAQDDVLFPHLTVTETLVFAALLKLPNNFSNKEKMSRAEAVISQLGLAGCKDGVIGDVGKGIPGVSGGERRRVSIGVEVLVNPSVLFLDEPTSGLDSTTAQIIVEGLWKVAREEGVTVVMSIHQPSSRLYYMFHKILVLCEGTPLYFGKGCDEALRYFGHVGFSPKLAMNPADFILDLANGVCSDEEWKDQAVVKQKLISEYKNQIEPQLKAMLDQEMGESSNDNMNDEEDREFGRWVTTWRQQFGVLLRRGVKERRHESFSYLRIAQVFVVSILTGLLWYNSHISNLQDQIGLLFHMVGFWGFFPLLQAIFTFPQERTMLTKERSSRTYRLSSYFLSRIAGDLPLELLLPTIFLMIVYWMAGLKPEPASFLYALLGLLLCILVSQGLGLALGALVMDQKAASTLGSVMMLSFMLAGGFYVQHVPKFIGWIKYVSVSYYTFRLFVGSQYGDKDTYPCGDDTCLVVDFPAIKHIGIGVMDQYVALVALVIMLVGYRLVAYLALMRIGRTKKLA